MEYLSGWEKGITAEGLWDFLGTLSAVVGSAAAVRAGVVVGSHRSFRLS